MEKNSEKESTMQSRKTRARLLVRLGVLLADHSLLVSVVSCFAGFLSLLLLPALSKNTYVSENALMPGSANTVYSVQDVIGANRFMADIFKLSQGNDAKVEIPKLMKKHMEDIGAEVYHHQFMPKMDHFDPLNFFTSRSNNWAVKSDGNCMNIGTNTVGILRAPRGDGKETIVLVSPYDSQNFKSADGLSLGLGFSIFSLLSQVTWLAKDIVWLAADSQFGDYASVSAWLNDYNNPGFLGFPGISDEKNCNTSYRDSFKRAATMAAALIIKVVEKEKDERDSLTMYAEATNGQMPNLDLLNVVHYLAVHRQGFRVKVDSSNLLIDSVVLKYIGKVLKEVSKLSRLINPDWKIDISPDDYAKEISTLASSIYNQALGVPTGPHGAFRDYQIDALSLEFSPRSHERNDNAKSAFLLSGGRLIEGVVRSVNNLLEKFHQSFFLYLLTAPNKFLSVGVYMIPFGLLILPLPIVAAALFSTINKKANLANNASGHVLEVTFLTWKWIKAAKTVFIVQLWAVGVSLLPYYISLVPNVDSAEHTLMWAALSIAVQFILYQMFGSLYAVNVEWELLKATMIITVFIGLCLMSIINFSIAQIAVLILVPMCLLVRPLRAPISPNFLLQVLLPTFNVALTVLGFPPALLLLTEGFSRGFGTLRIGLIWECMEFLWKWNSATYLYIFLVHFPCWLLCMLVLLHPCR